MEAVTNTAERKKFFRGGVGKRVKSESNKENVWGKKRNRGGVKGQRIEDNEG